MILHAVFGVLLGTASAIGQQPPGDTPRAALPLSGPEEIAPLIAAASGARLVLLGESTHGTSEFYTWRAEISRQLIAEAGFAFVAVEGDWTALAHLDRYVRHAEDAAPTAREALLRIGRWPLWMWANEEMAEFGEWLREFNRERAPEQRVGIFGVDVYGVWESLDAVLDFYSTRAPEAEPQVRELYGILARFHGDHSAYSRHIYELEPSAEAGVRRVTEKLLARHEATLPQGCPDVFDALQNAKVVEYAEKHFRHAVTPGPHSWNARARHFTNTTERLLDFFGANSKGIVWAHNTHIGDARATDMAHARQVNIGQLARERFGEENVFAVGFGTATGTVLAAREWAGRRETMQIPPPAPGSLEAALAAQSDSPSLLLPDALAAEPRFGERLPHRAIGVVYRPADERPGNYVPTVFNRRYDAFIFLPETRALTPLHAE